MIEKDEKEINELCQEDRNYNKGGHNMSIKERHVKKSDKKFIEQEYESKHMSINMRYVVKFIYGRYEIRDDFADRCLCYCYVSENAENICHAMNEQYIRDIKD